MCGAQVTLAAPTLGQPILDPPLSQATKQTTKQTAAALLTQTTTLFADEFSGAYGSAPDPAKWAFDVGFGNALWGNNEKQTYTASRANSFLNGNGQLVIRALRTATGFTSARLKTAGHFAFTYGRAEARIKVPAGQGLHPAFWMLGTNIGSVGWPRCGEIDVMETVNGATFDGNAIHGPKRNGSPYQLDRLTTVPVSLANAFHTYFVDRRPGVVTFGIDGTTLAQFRKSDLTGSQLWVYDAPMYLLLNIALGGDWPGPVSATTPFPADMIVDWVRVTS